MLPRNLIQILLSASKLVGRAVAKAVREEYAASQQASRSRSQQPSGQQTAAESVYADLTSGMSLEEAKQILNVRDLTDMEAINTNYSRMFEMNDKSRGGSLYLQSKVFRAKERIDQELQKDLKNKL